MESAAKGIASSGSKTERVEHKVRNVIKTPEYDELKGTFIVGLISVGVIDEMRILEPCHKDKLDKYKGSINEFSNAIKEIKTRTKSGIVRF